MTSSYSPSVPKPRAQAPRQYYTTAQRAAIIRLGELQAIARMDRVAGFKPKCRGLLIGPSGSGKSAVAAASARDNGMRGKQSTAFLTISAANYVVFGAGTQPHTITVLRDFVRRESAGVVLLDEIDKAIPVDGHNLSAWALSVFGEILTILDCDSRFLAMGWDASDEEEAEEEDDAPLRTMSRQEYAQVRDKVSAWILDCRRDLLNLQSQRYRIEKRIEQCLPLWVLWHGDPANSDCILKLTQELLGVLKPYEAGGFAQAEYCTELAGRWTHVVKEAIDKHARTLDEAGTLQVLVSLYELVDRINSTLRTLLGVRVEDRSV